MVDPENSLITHHHHHHHFFYFGYPELYLPPYATYGTYMSPVSPNYFQPPSTMPHYGI